MNDKHAINIVPESIEQALRGYLLSVRAAGSKAYTVVVYERSIRQLIRHLAKRGIRTMADVSTDHLREFFIELQVLHNKGGVQVFFRPIKAFFRWYWEEFEIEQRNPIEKVKIEPARTNPRPGVAVDHIERMIEACTTSNRHRDRALLLCLLDSGARATEICRLNVGDVDLVTGEVQIINAKGNKDRSVRFGDKALRALRRYLRRRGNLMLTSPLFQTRSGDRFTRFSLRLLVDRRADDAGVPRPGLHDFRRRCAYEMLRRGVPTKVISHYLGHSSVAVTERYLAMDDDDVLEAHRRSSPADHLRL
ncbi:MAG: site-specific integrase [Anaerolineales bacterium]|nr:site-specific integrase [Anaerolineales bacterium]